MYFPAHLGRMRLQSEVRLPPPLPSKHQLGGEGVRRVAQLCADVVTCEALAPAVFWLLHPGFKFSVPLRARRQRTRASRLLPAERVERGGGGTIILVNSCSIGSLYAIKKQLVLGLMSSANGYL